MENEIIQGINNFLLYRILGDTVAGTKIANQTNHNVSSARNVGSTATKDGTKRSPGQLEQEITANVLLSNREDVDKLKDAQEQGKIVELWDINSMVKNEQGEYKATYYQGYVSNISTSAPTEDGVSVDFTFSIESYGKRGYTPLTAEQEAVIDYAFTKATAIEGTATEGATPEGTA